MIKVKVFFMLFRGFGGWVIGWFFWGKELP